MRYFVILALLLLSSSAVAQEQDPLKPATKIEAFQANTGIVLIRGYTKVGTLRGLGGVVTVDAREYRDAEDPAKRITGISISVKETSRVERENTSFIDTDEIDGLLQGIDYIAKVSKEITTFEHFEVEYRTKGDFRLIVFNDSSGQLSLAISSGRVGKTTAYLELKQLDELKKLVATAKSKL